MSNALIPSGGTPHPHGEAQTPPENPILLLHRYLRGRYIWAVVAAVILGPLGAAVGYFSVQLEYTSSSSLQIAPALQKILFESDQNQTLPMFDSYLRTQVSLISSPRVLQDALQSTTWQEVGGRFSLEELEKFTSSLSVAQLQGTQLIQVNFTDRDPIRARAGARAVVDTYRDIYVETDTQSDFDRFSRLEKRAASLRTAIATANANIDSAAAEFGSDDLSSVYEFELENLQTIQSELEAAKLQLNSLESISDAGSARNTLDYTTLSIEEIALIDPRMQSLLDERSALRQEKDHFEATLRKPESRAEYRTLVKRLEEKESEVETYAKAFRESPLLAPMGSPDSMPLAPTAAAVTQLRAKVERLQQLYDEANDRTTKVGKKNVELKGFRAELQRLEDDLDLTNKRIEQLTLEGSERDRISVVSEADTPASPSNAKRRIQLVILGGLGGGGLGIALVVALGFLKSNIRDITDAQAIQPRLLGALPLLPDHLHNFTEVAAAAQAVHNIRTVLHAHMPTHESLCLTITASSSGAGKTSFALSLGLSFASAGARTLIIDGDLLGQGLTRRTGAKGRRKLGHVLRAYEVITEEESRHALQVARQQGRPIGHALIELGYISESDLEDGLAMQNDAGLGLADALNGEHFENCLADIGVPGLSILPYSRSRVAQSHTMSPVAFRRLLDELRPSFDIILIDSGPVPGATDATIMSICSDGVLMLASRGDSGTEVQRALRHLSELSVPVVGLVFNRADAQDIERSRYSTSRVSNGGRDIPPISPESPAEDSSQLAELLAEVKNFGPLAQSVWLSTTYPETLSRAEVLH